MTKHTRREFLIATAGVGVCAVTGTGLGQTKSPNEKLNLGFVGLGGRGNQNLAEMDGENVVGLCDVDGRHLGKAGEKYPKSFSWATMDSSPPLTTSSNSFPSPSSPTSRFPRFPSRIRTPTTRSGSGPARRASNVVPLRLRRPARRSRATGARGPPRRAADRVGRRERQATNCPEADRFIRPDYRKGWEL
jgi:hypothetical protein